MAFGLEGVSQGQAGEEGKASEVSVTHKPQAALAPAQAEDSEQVPAGAGWTVAPAGWGSVGQKLEPLLWGTLDEVQRHNRVASDKGSDIWDCPKALRRQRWGRKVGGGWWWQSRGAHRAGCQVGLCTGSPGWGTPDC